MKKKEIPKKRLKGGKKYRAEEEGSNDNRKKISREIYVINTGFTTNQDSCDTK